MKLITEALMDRILAVHIIELNTDEMAAEATLAVNHCAISEAVVRCDAHPPLCEASKDATMAASSRPIWCGSSVGSVGITSM